MIDDRPTPPMGFTVTRPTPHPRAQPPGTGRQGAPVAPSTLSAGGRRPLHLPRPVSTTVKAGSGVRRCRVVSADDSSVWAAPDGTGAGLLQLAAADRPAAWERLSDGAPLAVLCAPADTAGVRREAALARSVLDIPIAVIPTSTGPLGRYAGTVLAAHLLADPQGRTESTVLAMLPELLTQLPDIGITRSVASLDLPGVGLRHHLASYLPGRGMFAVQLSPRPGVAKLHGELLKDADGVIRPLEADLHGGMLLIHGGTPVPASLLVALGVDGAALQIPNPPLLKHFWGSAEATEVVVLPKDPPAWAAARMPFGLAVGCPWCGQPLASGLVSCLFCGNTTR